MNSLLKSISYIFHPLIMPLLGVLFYFSKSPRFIPSEIIQAKIVSLFILTIILPILLYLILKLIGLVNTVNLKTTKERIYPLILNCIVIILVLQRILTPAQSIELVELYFFFIGILISTVTCLALALVKFKASIHMIASAGFFMFAIAIAIHFKININGTIALMCIILGAIATSRLHMNAHTSIELIAGFFVGLMPQLILLNYWM